MRERLQRFVVLSINGKTYELPVGNGPDEVPQCETLATTLRERLNLTGAKIGCGQGACGACTVIMDGKAVTSCLLLTVNCEGAEIVTIEGLADARTGELTGLQQAFVDNCGFQCGYCTPGIIMVTEALLRKNSKPTEAEVREALGGNYCRCGTHYTAIDSIMAYVNKQPEVK